MLTYIYKYSVCMVAIVKYDSWCLGCGCLGYGCLGCGCLGYGCLGHVGVWGTDVWGMCVFGVRMFGVRGCLGLGVWNTTVSHADMSGYGVGFPGLTLGTAHGK